MGYTSDIGLVLDKTAHETFLEVIKEHEKKVKDIVYFRTFFSEAQHKERDNCFLYFWEGLKWYSTVEEVATVEDLMDKLDVFIEITKGEKGQYRFVRIRDDSEDIEFRGEFYDNPFELYVKREISFIEEDR